eukprot:scaffold42830_cov176-Amphora_coffeaeformis.AAC.2
MPLMLWLTRFDDARLQNRPRKLFGHWKRPREKRSQARRHFIYREDRKKHGSSRRTGDSRAILYHAVSTRYRTRPYLASKTF